MSIIHFDFIFLCGVRVLCLFLLFCFCISESKYSGTVYWKDYTFSIKLPLCPVKNELAIYVQAYIWPLHSMPLMYLSILIIIPPCLDYCRSILSPEIRLAKSSNSVLLFQNCFSQSSSLCFYKNFMISLPIPFKSSHWKFYQNCIESID